MINLIIGNPVEAQTKAIEMCEGKSVFRLKNCYYSINEALEGIKERDLLLIKNLDDEMLFEGIVECVEALKDNNIETIAITYRDDIIEAYEDVEDVNIIDLRGE
jgi:hypothetical protein